MKTKLIQIALGAVGSIVTVLIQYYAGGNPDAVVALMGGAASNAVLGGAAEGLIS